MQFGQVVLVEDLRVVLRLRGEVGFVELDSGDLAVVDEEVGERVGEGAAVVGGSGVSECALAGEAGVEVSDLFWRAHSEYFVVRAHIVHEYTFVAFEVEVHETVFVVG